MVPEATSVCQYEHLFAVLKTVSDDAVHRVQDIWDAKLTT